MFLARARVSPHHPAALDVMASPSFDPSREVVLLGEAAGTPSGAAPAAGRLTLASHRADRVAADVDLDGPAWLVLGEMNAPGWTATVDGAATPVRVADLLFSAAEIPAGRHRVVFEYHAPGARAGLAATLAALAALGFLFATPGRRRAGLPRQRRFATIAAP